MKCYIGPYIFIKESNNTDVGEALCKIFINGNEILIPNRQLFARKVHYCQGGEIAPLDEVPMMEEKEAFIRYYNDMINVLRQTCSPEICWGVVFYSN